MTITFNSKIEFYDGIASLVKRGLTFEANDDTLVITLTGGY